MSNKWPQEKYAYKIRSNSNMPVKSIKQYNRREHVVEVSRSTLYRVRKDSNAKFLGCEKEQYKVLWSYGAELRISNPGTTYIIKVTPLGPNSAMLKRVYYDF